MANRTEAEKNRSRNAVRFLVGMLRESTPADVIASLRPREITYLCELCDELRALHLCEDVFYNDDDDEPEEEED